VFFILFFISFEISTVRTYSAIVIIMQPTIMILFDLSDLLIFLHFPPFPVFFNFCIVLIKA